MKDKFVCPICGDTTDSYMGNHRKDGLCKKHTNDYKNGELLQCKVCSKWHYSDKPCACDKQTHTTSDEFFKCFGCSSEPSRDALCKHPFNKYTKNELLDVLNCCNSKLVEQLSVNTDNKITQSSNSNYDDDNN